MASALPLISSFLVSLLLCFCCSNVHGGRGQSHQVVRVDSLMAATACSSPKDYSQNSLKLAHQHGPCSPIADKKKPSHHEILQQDQLRVASLQQRLSRASQGAQVQDSMATLPASNGIILGTGNYLVTVGFGTPKKDQTVIFDTGSNVCWIQCKPCLDCYQQQRPVFNPSESSSFQKVSCNSGECGRLSAKNCSGSRCTYHVLYADKSYTNGILSKETLTLTPTNVFPDFVFGCGQNNRGGTLGRTSGLLGLGRDTLSLVSQTSENFGQVFSYCLPPSSSSTGYLTFGKTTASNATLYTPMLTDARDPSLYFLNLTGISVGGQQLSILPRVFTYPGTIIDSGTVITRLPPSAYVALRSAFRGGMSNYPMAPPTHLFDTCYDLSGKENVTLPSVALHFDGGVDVNLSRSGILFGVDASQVCLAFAGNGPFNDVGIIGNVQQQTVEVTYDLGMKRIGFSSRACS